MKATVTIRMTLASYRRIRREFKAERGESAASYFERLSKMLAGWEWETEDNRTWCRRKK